MRYWLLGIITVAALTLYFWPHQETEPELILGADTGFASADTASNDATLGGANSWAGIANILLSDNIRASGTGGSSCSGITLTDIRLVVGGTITGDDKATGQDWSPASDHTETVGGAADLWGVALTPADVNATTFGFGVSATNNLGGVTNYAVTTDFDFTVPADATIVGVEATIEGLCQSASPRIDHMQMKIYYTPAGEQTVRAINNGTLRVDNGRVIINGL